MYYCWLSFSECLFNIFGSYAPVFTDITYFHNRIIYIKSYRILCQKCVSAWQNEAVGTKNTKNAVYFWSIILLSIIILIMRKTY